MKRRTIVILIIILLGFFALISNAILGIKILELKVQLTKSQIMNYEFSSEILKKKFKQMLDVRENYSAEIETSAMESSVLNFEGEEKKMKMGLNQKLGLIVVNVIRKLSFKDFIYLDDDQTTLLKLQYAFLLERNQKYLNASEKYSELEKDLLTGLKEDRAFVLLHNGYCIALTGDTPGAIVKLEEVISSYPGTHFSNSARILIEILRETGRRTQLILSSTTANENLVEKLFKTGQYALVITELEKVENLTYMERYMRARSNEKIGNSQISTPEYTSLAGQREDLEVAKLANRRLLMLGNIYGGDKKIAQKAEETATNLGDNVVAEEIKEGSKKQIASIVIEKIKKNPDNLPEELKKIKEEIIKEMPALAALTVPKEKEEEKPEPVKVVRKIEPEKTPDQQIIIRLTDGRSVSGDRIQFEDYKMFITSGTIKTSIPDIMVKKIELKFTPDTIKERGALFVRTKSKNYPSVVEVNFNEEQVLFKAADGSDLTFELEKLKEVSLGK